MDPHATNSAFLYSAVIAWMSAKAIEWCKNSKWPIFAGITQNSTTLNRWVARLVALVAAFGINVTFDAQAGTLIFAGLTLTGIGSSVLEFGRQYMFQQIAYQKLIKEPQPTDAPVMVTPVASRATVK